MKIEIWSIFDIVLVNIRHVYEVPLKRFRDIGYILWIFLWATREIFKNFKNVYVENV